MTTTQISAPFISQGEDGPLHLDMTLTRAKFEDLISDLVESTLKPVRQAIKDAKIKKEDIDKVLLVGGSTRIPMVQELIKLRYHRRELPDPGPWHRAERLHSAKHTDA